MEESSKRRYTSRLCQYLSDFGRWLAQPYNAPGMHEHSCAVAPGKNGVLHHVLQVDIEPPDSDDERNDGKQEEEHG